MSLKLSGTISIVIGAVLSLLLILCWAYISALNPLPTLLIGIGVTGLGLRTAITAVDLVINLILCLPAAWALLCLGARHIHANSLLALLSFAVTGAVKLGVPNFSFDFANWFMYILFLTPLPLSVWILSKLMGNASNYSFKPRPLRGPA